MKLYYRIVNYYRRTAHDRLTGILLLLVAVLVAIILSLVIYISQRMDEKGVLIPVLITAVANIFASIGVSLVFSSLDRRSLLTPIMVKNKEIHDEILKELSSFTDVSNSMSDQITKMSEYDRYTISRNIYGFHVVVGPARRDGGDTRDPGFVGFNLISKILNDAAPGTEVWHMISYIEHHVDLAMSIYAAVERGVHIKFLLMNPKPTAPAVLARFEDLRQVYKVPSWNNVQEFCDDIMRTALSMKRAKEMIESINRREKLTGSFEVRYFSRSLNFPLTISIPKDNIAGQVAYTGIYSSNHVEFMPYVAWRGGEFRMVQQLREMFKRKWDACEENLAPESGSDDTLSSGLTSPP